MSKKPPPGGPRQVALLIRINGQTRGFIDVQAFVNVVIRAGEQHLGLEQLVRIDLANPNPIPEGKPDAAGT